MRVFEISKDGLPNMTKLTGRVAFIFDGCIVSGWPLYGVEGHIESEWEADSDKLLLFLDNILDDCPSEDYQEGEPQGEYESDGHYLCEGCVHFNGKPLSR